MPTAPLLHRVEPGSEVDLGSIDPGDTSAAPGGSAPTTTALEALSVRLADLQTRLHAGGEHRVLLVLQGPDTSGKGGTIKHVLGAVNPIGLRLVSFKAPTHAELARDYLWRVHANVPADGEIGVFDRSHYEDVIVARVEELVPPDRWRRRYAQINAFEQLLVEEGTTVVKVLLHISKEEQRKRLQSRLEEPHKRWKLHDDDLRARARWDDYQAATNEAIARTSTSHAPWHVIPADHKWYRNWAVATILVEALEGLDLRWPERDDLDGVVVV